LGHFRQEVLTHTQSTSISCETVAAQAQLLGHDCEYGRKSGGQRSGEELSLFTNSTHAATTKATNGATSTTNIKTR